jgi:hypothetical protein
LAYFVPKPLVDQGYAVILGLLEWAMARTEASPLNAMPYPPPVGNVDGLAYLVPNPLAAVHGYADTNGVVV